jgi:hypothetical protein
MDQKTMNIKLFLNLNLSNMTSIQCVQDRMQIPVNFFFFFNALDEKGGKFAVSKQCLA